MRSFLIISILFLSSTLYGQQQGFDNREEKKFTVKNINTGKELDTVKITIYKTTDAVFGYTEAHEFNRSIILWFDKADVIRVVVEKKGFKLETLTPDQLFGINGTKKKDIIVNLIPPKKGVKLIPIK